MVKLAVSWPIGGAWSFPTVAGWRSSGQGEALALVRTQRICGGLVVVQVCCGRLLDVGCWSWSTRRIQVVGWLGGDC